MLADDGQRRQQEKDRIADGIKSVDLVQVARADLPDLERSTRRYWRARCPFHTDGTPSFTIYTEAQERDRYYCFGCGAQGDVIDYLRETRGYSFREALRHLGIITGPRPHYKPMPPREVPPSAPAQKPLDPPARPPDHVHDNYREPDGARRYQVRRWELTAAEQEVYGDTKYIRPYHEEAGRWRQGVGPAGRCLYGRPALHQAAPDAIVWLVEGEKKADRLSALGLLAVTSGASHSWQAEYADELSGHPVIILPDNDEPGHKYAAAIVASREADADTKILELPGLGVKEDVVDFLDRTGFGAEAMRALAMMARPARVAEEDVAGAEIADLLRDKQLEIEAERERAEAAEARLRWADSIIMAANDRLQQNHRTAMYCLQRYMDAKGLQPGDRIETTAGELGAFWGASASTAGRRLDSLNGSGLHIIEHTVKKVPRLNEDGVVFKLKNGQVMTDSSTVVEILKAPIDLDPATLSSPPSRASKTSAGGFLHGGARTRCRNGHKLDAARYCPSCREVYGADGETFIGLVMTDEIDVVDSTAREVDSPILSIQDEFGVRSTENHLEFGSEPAPRGPIQRVVSWPQRVSEAAERLRTARWGYEGHDPPDGHG